MTRARICAVGTSVPPYQHTQEQILEELGIEDPKVRSIFLNSAIETRHLVLPPRDEHGRRVTETQGQLLAKHREWSVQMAAEALHKCLAEIGRTVQDVDYLCCVTTTGFMTPGVSARLMEHVGMRPDCSRLDVVGMGCNAGLSALAPVVAWAETHPGQLAIMVCVEVCSAAYVADETMRTAVVNSLFGDGGAAVAVSTDDVGTSAGPQVLRTNSHIVLSAIEAMRYDWDDKQGLFSFFLDPHIPYVIGANVEASLTRLLSGSGIGIADVDHWLVHSGGKKVVDAVRVNLGLSRHDLRNTSSVLRDYGNLSSGSFLFSYDKLCHENIARSGDFAVMATMGPGSTIETALLQWT